MTRLEERQLRAFAALWVLAVALHRRNLALVITAELMAMQALK